jgi:ferredoxin
LQAGATAVQICTAAIVRGNEIYGKVATQIEEWMDQRGFKSPAELTGRTVRLMRARPFYSTYKMAELPVPTVITEKCTGCGICITSCVYEAIVQPRKKAVINIAAPDCWRCGLCITRCPPGALFFETSQ